MVHTEHNEYKQVIGQYFGNEGSSESPEQGTKVESMLNELWTASSSRCTDIDSLQSKLSTAEERIKSLEEELKELRAIFGSFASGLPTCDCSQEVARLRAEMRLIHSKLEKTDEVLSSDCPIPSRETVSKTSTPPPP